MKLQTDCKVLQNVMVNDHKYYLHDYFYESQMMINIMKTL